MSFNLLHVTPSFYPASYFGGPIISTYALCNALAGKPDIALRVLTTDTAGPERHQRLAIESNPVRYPSGYEVFFARRLIGVEISPEMLFWLWKLVGWADAIQLTGTYSFPTIPTLFFARLRTKPVLWSPHGALLASETWARVSYQSAKRLWEKTCELIAPAQTILHATSHMESLACNVRLPTIGTVVIPNGVEIPDPLKQREWLPDGRIRVMFIGRLHPIKGLDRLIKAVGLLESDAFRLDIYGDGDESYRAELKSLAERQKSAGNITFHGHVEGKEKKRAFAGADVCVLPSHSENFGMAVAEALAHGVPVIAARGVPWAEVEPRGCGLWLDNSPSTIAKALLQLRSASLPTMGERGRAWMSESFGWNSIAERTLETLTRLAKSPGLGTKNI